METKGELIRKAKRFISTLMKEHDRRLRLVEEMTKTHEYDIKVIKRKLNIQDTKPMKVI